MLVKLATDVVSGINQIVTVLSVIFKGTHIESWQLKLAVPFDKISRL